MFIWVTDRFVVGWTLVYPCHLVTSVYGVTVAGMELPYTRSSLAKSQDGTSRRGKNCKGWMDRYMYNSTC